MKVQIDLGARDPSWLGSSQLFGIAILPVLRALSQVNLFYLKMHPQTPMLYESGVRYREEPKEWTVESFDSIPAVLARGWGDCDDLAPWRVAELNHHVYNDPMRPEWKAQIRISWRRGKSGRLFHITVRHPSEAGIAGEGRWEDPSRILGMGT